jgi:hypothetical protein
MNQNPNYKILEEVLFKLDYGWKKMDEKECQRYISGVYFLFSK